MCQTGERFLFLPDDRISGAQIHREVNIKMPSNAILEQKQQAVAELAELIKASTSGVIVNYQGITVDKDTAMRKALREAGVKYMVVKNSLTGRACDMCGYGELKNELKGMTAIAISENDPIAPAKILKEYDEKVESFKILAGYCDGAVLDANGVKELADIPSKEVLIAKFLGSIQSPVYKFAYAIKAAAEKLEGGDAPAEETAEA
jgi:large subunit ribosomal protein L10